MFDSLLAFWRGKDFLTQVLEDLRKMLDHAETMFRMVCQTLLDNAEQPDLKERIYAIDKQINELQQGIRKRVMEHMTLQPAVETSSCLCMMSVAKDAERLGDYAKNLYEVIGLREKPIDRDQFATFFNGLDAEILTLFDQTRKAFVDGDESKARAAWNVEHRLAKQCDAIVENVAHSDLPSNTAVCYVLIARYFKRTIAHLANIATAAILPVDKLDYFDERHEPVPPPEIRG